MGPARMFMESLTKGPELENSHGHFSSFPTVERSGDFSQDRTFETRKTDIVARAAALPPEADDVGGQA